MLEKMTAVKQRFNEALRQLGRLPRLLIVDDQPINIQALYQVFATDFQVFMATSGQQGLNLCRERSPDLVLLDVQMPDMDGHEVCRSLKADPELQDIPVIFVTAHNDPQSETDGLSVGAVDFISKPFNPNVVRARVMTHLTLKLQGDILRQMVFIDGLTGVFNRRHFDEKLYTECQRARRNGTSLSLLVIDVDFFKRYNDHYGHLAGDEALRQVAALLKTQLKRPADIACRYGGEEFACVLPETEADGATQLAKEIEQALRMLQIPHAESELGPYLTVSIGVATMKVDNGRTASDLVAAADAQLYQAKTNGRGQVCGVTI